MTIRFTLAHLLIHSSLIGTTLFGSSYSAIAHSQISTAIAHNSSTTGVAQKSLVALRLPFFKRRKNKKTNREETNPIPNPSNDSNSREYIFRAPQTTGQKQSTNYQVQVYGSDRDLLKKVQAIEPKAFLKGNLIQVGVFSKQENAEELLQKLAMQGFWARIIVNK